MMVRVSFYICVLWPQKWVYEGLVCCVSSNYIFVWGKMVVAASVFACFHAPSPGAAGAVPTPVCSSAICASYL